MSKKETTHNWAHSNTHILCAKSLELEPCVPVEIHQIEGAAKVTNRHGPQIVREIAQHIWPTEMFRWNAVAICVQINQRHRHQFFVQNVVDINVHAIAIHYTMANVNANHEHPHTCNRLQRHWFAAPTLTICPELKWIRTDRRSRIYWLRMVLVSSQMRAQWSHIPELRFPNEIALESNGTGFSHCAHVEIRHFIWPQFHCLKRFNGTQFHC